MATSSLLSPSFSPGAPVSDPLVSWRQQISTVVLEILNTIQTNPPLWAQNNEPYFLVDPSVLPVWVQALTPPGVESDENKNYERYEILGDSVVSTDFILYVMNRYPQVDTSGISELKKYYMGKQFQILLAREMKLDTLIHPQLQVENSDLVLGDMFESFFGALYRVAQQVIPDKTARLTQAVLATALDRHPLDLSLQKGPQITQVNQIFERLYPRPPPLELTLTPNNKGQYQGRLYLTPQHQEFFKNYGLNFSSTLLASGIGNTERSAKNAVYTTALQKLEEIGITTAWADQVRENNYFRHPRLVPHLEKLLTLIKEKGYQRVYFEEPSKLRTPQTKVLTFNALDQQGQRQVLAKESLNLSGKSFQDRLQDVMAREKLLQAVLDQN
jgi:dsRNA-specific ribonuclease